MGPEQALIGEIIPVISDENHEPRIAPLNADSSEIVFTPEQIEEAQLTLDMCLRSILRTIEIVDDSSKVGSKYLSKTERCSIKFSVAQYGLAEVSQSFYKSRKPTSQRRSHRQSSIHERKRVHITTFSAASLVKDIRRNRTRRYAQV